MKTAAGFLFGKIPGRDRIPSRLLNECRTFLFSLSLVILCAEFILSSAGEGQGPGGGPFPRGLFAASFTLFFFLTGVFRYLAGFFAEGYLPPLLSLLPTLLILFLRPGAGSFPFFSHALIAAAAAGAFFDFVPRRELFLRWGIFALDAAGFFLFLSGRAFAGSFITDRILFVFLVILTLSALQEIMTGRKGEAFPLHFFLLLGALLMVLPMGEKPIDWSPLVREGSRLVHRFTDLADSMSYYLFSGFDDGTYTAGYSSLEAAGGRLSDSERTQIILRTGESPCYTYIDPDTSREMWVRRVVYLTGGRGADRRQLVRFLQFLHDCGVDRSYASLFSRVSEMNVEYACLNTFDEIAPAASFLLRSGNKRGRKGDGTRIESGTGTSMHRKGYRIDAEYLDIDYGSPYLTALLRKAGEPVREDRLSYGEACGYAEDLYRIRLEDVLTRQEYEELNKEGSEDLSAWTDTEGAGSRMKKLAAELTEGVLDDYEKCRRIEKYLRQYRYDKRGSPGRSPHSDMTGSAGMSDIADRFLFETGAGYCVHYTSSMVMLLRLCGIPARPVPGYRFAFPREQEDSYPVAGSMAHVWPEAYLGNAGWVPFEPTASFWAAEEYSWHKAAPEAAGEEQVQPSPDLPGPRDTVEEESAPENTGLQILRTAGYLILFTVLLLAAVIACRVLSGLIRYRVGSPEEKLAMDAEAIKKQIRRRAGEDFPDRGLLSDYVNRAPLDLQDDIRRVFDAYYRILYGNAGTAGVSPPENDLARRVREELGQRRHSAVRSAAGEGRET